MKPTFFVTTALALALSSGAVLCADRPGATTATPPVTSSQPVTETLVGRDAYSQDQTLVGQVERVEKAPDGRIIAIFLKTGGFLGFGARLVTVPEDKFRMRGQNVQLQLTSEEVQKLPEVKGSS